MLKIIEYSLLAVSLLVVIGLIVSGSRGDSESSGKQPPALPSDAPEAQDPEKSL
jgi:hypothetical protein